MILVVDDIADNRDMYIEYLRHVGFRAVGAVDGETAIRTARRIRPAAILMDMALPGIDGWEATRRLKASPATQHIPIIAVTGHAELPYFERAAEVGCDLFLTKPALPCDITAQVIRLLGERDGRDAATARS
jgi:CheY-like chemotaxis protein